MGDDYHQNHFLPSDGRQNRGIFQMDRWTPISAISDGTSTTVMLGEMATRRGSGRRDRRRCGDHAVMESRGLFGRRDPANPIQLTRRCVSDFRPAVAGLGRASLFRRVLRRWSGRTGPSCHWGGVDGNEHMGTMSSRHPGGGHVAMGDASVQFIQQGIDTGVQSVDDIATSGLAARPLGCLGGRWAASREA